MVGDPAILTVLGRQVAIDIKSADRRDVSTGACRMNLSERYVKSNALKKSVQAAWHMDNSIALSAASSGPCYEAPLHPFFLKLLYAVFERT